MLSLLSAKGVCVIVDSCYAGGFNDKPYFSWFTRSRHGFIPKGNRVSASKWIHELGQELRGKGRVVLMACREDELSYGSKFTKILIEGLRGYADTNKNGIVSAEEAYQYAKDNIDSSKMHPTIFDNYLGELPLTDVELPPTKPKTPLGQIIGETNITYNYSTVSTDSESDKIKYGWDLDSDNIVDEWSDLFDSGVQHNFSLSWAIEGTYNIKVKAVDEHGVESEWSNQAVVIMYDDNVPDQRQTEMGGGTYMDIAWFAQSFIPTLSTLSKVELGIESWGGTSPKIIHMYIRDNLSGENLAECSRIVPPLGPYKCAWSTFDFEDLDVILGNTYYIICKKTDSNWAYVWRWYSDIYPFGGVFESADGDTWRPFHHNSFDCCFVTWGKI